MFQFVDQAVQIMMWNYWTLEKTLFLRVSVYLKYKWTINNAAISWIICLYLQCSHCSLKYLRAKEIWNCEVCSKLSLPDKLIIVNSLSFIQVVDRWCQASPLFIVWHCVSVHDIDTIKQLSFCPLSLVNKRCHLIDKKDSHLSTKGVTCQH